MLCQGWVCVYVYGPGWQCNHIHMPVSDVTIECSHLINRPFCCTLFQMAARTLVMKRCHARLTTRCASCFAPIILPVDKSPATSKQPESIYKGHEPYAPIACPSSLSSSLSDCRPPSARQQVCHWVDNTFPSSICLLFGLELRFSGLLRRPTFFSSQIIQWQQAICVLATGVTLELSVKSICLARRQFVTML